MSTTPREVPERGFAPSAALVRDGFKTFRGTLVGSFALLASGRILQLAAGGLLAAVFLSVASPGEAATASIGPLSIGTPSTAQLVGLTTVLVVVLAFASWLTFSGRSRVASLAAAYERACSERTIEVGLRRLGQGMSDRDVLRLATRDSRYAGRGLAEIGAALVPAVTVLLGLMVLFILSWLLTASLLLLAVAAWPIHRWVIDRGSRSMIGIETLSRTDALEKASLLQQLAASHHPDTDLRSLVLRTLDTPTYNDYLASYAERLRAPHFSILVGSVQSAVLVGAALIYLAAANALTGASLPSVVLYFFVLQFVLASTLSLGKHANNLRIFQTQFRRVLTFQDPERDATEVPSTCSRLAYVPHLGPDTDRPLDVLAVLDGPDDRTHVRRTAQTLVQAGIWPAEIAGHEGVLTQLPPARGGPETEYYEDLHQRAVSTSSWPALKSTVAAPFITTDSMTAHLDRLFVSALGLSRTSATYVAINAKDYQRLGEDRRSAVQRELGERPVLLCLPYTKKEWPQFDHPSLSVAVIDAQVVDLCITRDLPRHRDAWDELFAIAARPSDQVQDALDDPGLEEY